MRPYIVDNVMCHDSPREGGLWLRTICEPCNGLASRYDDAYGELANRVSLIDRLNRRGFAQPSHPYGVPSVHVAPGRVARSVLHGMVALAPSMNLMHEEFLTGLLKDDTQIRLPPGLQLRVARAVKPLCRIASAYSMLQVLGQRQVYDVFAEIYFAPFIWVLCSKPPDTLGHSLIELERWGDATDWIRYSSTATRSDLRDVLDRLPTTVHPIQRNRQQWIELSSPDQTYLLEGLIHE
ncbi:hypothetical protein MNAB215_4133 [Mycobacterium numidiamassiliense]|uniref:Uncharacterized protein n=1 Tax=Mycobacterium numidiamassiliense TaxID=1841861 RepID=A0A2U3PDR8_9MYCO|nr:hypothetical protein MNAB215_4133 [Mycobacterium numidiamassiliense]